MCLAPRTVGTAPTPDTEERLDYLFCECGHHEDRHYWTCDVCGHQPPYTPLGATPPQAASPERPGLREALRNAKYSNKQTHGAHDHDRSETCGGEFVVGNCIVRRALAPDASEGGERE